MARHLSPVLICVLFLSTFIFVQKAFAQEAPAENGLKKTQPACAPPGFEIYKPTYGIFQLGTKDPRTENFPFVKFQINLTRKVFDKELLGVPTELALAYTIKALWDIAENSAPFKDYSHNPEAFFVFYKKSWVNTRVGIEHESNGKAGADSRSWNRLYVQPRVLLKMPTNRLGFHSAGVYLKGWLKFHGDDDNNRNITDYYGYGELALKLYGDENIFSVTHYRGRKVDFGTTTLEYMRRLENGWALYFQYFDGYGETLLDYDKRGRRFGLGFSLHSF